MRLTSWVAAGLLCLSPATVRAQITQVGLRLGTFTYDAGSDRSFFTLQIAAEHSVASDLRLGILGSWSHVGKVPRPWVTAVSSERVLRGLATVGYAPHPFSHIGGLKQLTTAFVAGVGVVHSAGVETDFSQYQNDPFFGITNQRTGLAYGGGLTLEVPLASHAVITGTFHYWRDHLYGGHLDNFDQLVGLAWRF